MSSSENAPPNSDFSQSDLKALFDLADHIGNRHYHKLTAQDFEDYRRYDYWRYVNGDGECGTTPASQQWVRDNSDRDCPVCERRFAEGDGRTIDHKLPRAQYPWLSLNFANFWVICRECNQEKAELNWYEYERYMLEHHSDRYPQVQLARPRQLLKTFGNPQA
jgi:5-methylcytosine-specific restriction endonuclease McrA